ncbi:MAG: sugar phosphate isomerase/epimerase [Victivallales bacterium]|nr:sugar phosphate isomerase/epimerase [Victivallales bacterium]
MRIGTISNFRDDVQGMFDRVAGFGLEATQVAIWDMTKYTDENAAKVKKASADSGVAIAAIWSGYSGKIRWNFIEGPITLGIVPESTRRQRLEDLKKGADFALKVGAPAIITHCGFIPENMTDYTYGPFCDAVYEIGSYCKERGLGFWFETGQETPVVLLRTITRVGLDNLGINLDPANLIMYGKGSPCDAIEVFGKYVRNMHVKDGIPPVDGDKLGKEVQVGQGAVNFPRLLPRLKEMGFDGDLIIEREIAEGAEQNKNILETVENIRKWWK